ncbi:MAG TPA: hypothetical protein VJ386_02070 [Candidatus Deferrimicrobiaceae bacterium]|nr:hypothetical protein [Candidatus Deferrimicrobiaceae bacterium]
MTGAAKTRGGLAGMCVLAGVLVALTQFGPIAKDGASLLLALLFWATVIEGCVAAVAAGTLIKARWVASVKRELLSVYPLLLFVSILFLFLVPFVDSYPWAGRRGIWFDKKFFVGRNFALLLLAYLSARRFAIASERGEEGEKVLATLYLFVFVVSQSLMAFDWVMSLMYPWISSLLGGYFFIESLFGGFALSGILYVFLYGRQQRVGEPEGRSDMKDLAILLFGFSLLWAGLFYSQFLVIWYGNIPEEVSFLVTRLSSSPLREFTVSIVFFYFFIPFLVLLPGRSKTNPYVVFAVSLSVLLGILVERFVFVAPVVTPGPLALGIDFLVFLVLFVFFVVKTGKVQGRS